MGSGGRGRFGPLPAYLGEGRLIRPPRTTAGPPKRLEADRERTGAPDLPGAESSGRPGPAPETRPPTRTEVLGQKSPRGTPGVPASKIESRSPASCSPRSRSGQALLLETRTSWPRRKRPGRSVAPAWLAPSAAAAPSPFE